MISEPSDTRSKERLRGTVLRITYHNRENDYRVIKLLPDEEVEAERLDKRGEVVMVGQLPGIEVGESVEAEGRWAVHPRHGPQFKADWFKPSLPTGVRGIESYLKSGAIKGVGEVIAKRIVEAFGEKTFDILDEDISRLRQIKGITRRRLEGIEESWTEARTDRELITFLGEHGIAAGWATRLRKTYGGAALSVIRSNPYRLAAEVRGIGFHRADVMARRIGIPTDSPERVDAALGHVLETQAGDGHTYSTRPGLMERAIELLEVDAALVEGRLDRMIERGLLTEEPVAGEKMIFLNTLHEAEQGCAENLRRLAEAKRRVPEGDVEAFLKTFEQRSRFQLASAQREAVMAITREGMLILTGGPGTGKTTTLRTVIEAFKAGGRSVRLAAPTGRAARRLSEASRTKAETIHRLLGFQPRTGNFTYGESEKLDADLIVVDEVSMLDVLLAHDLLRALKNGTCLLLVGDEDQLPSVGPGNVLRDIIASERMPVVRLTEIFRQAESSLIVTNAHRINHGQFPLLDPPEGMDEPDFFFVERNEPAEVLEAIKTLVAERIPRRFNLDPVRDIQVLTPMRRGQLGVESINRELQRLLNRTGAESATAVAEDEDEDGPAQKLRVGDRVMQTVNDYDKDVSNGDIGRVVSIDADLGEMIIQFDERKVSYLADEVRQMTLAYAVTIHKSQGSEYPAVVIPIHMQHYIMLQRNLIYTALTRGRRLVCLVGTKSALWRAVRNSTRRSRNSALEFFLRKNR